MDCGGASAAMAVPETANTIATMRDLSFMIGLLETLLKGVLPLSL
jgi:hypothetical protein